MAGSGDYLSKTLNTLFNPFEYENILSPPNSTPGNRAMHHAGGLMVGYGGLAIVARKLMQARDESEKNKAQGKLRAFSSARYPTISIDPSLEDEEEEAMLEAPGVEESEAFPELAKSASSFLTQLVDPVTGAAVKTMRGQQDPAHLALAAAAAVMGGAAGWKFADYLSDTDRKNELDDRIKGKANEIDKILYDEMQRREKTASMSASEFRKSHPGSDRTSYSAATPGKSKPGLFSTMAWPPHLLKGMESLWWLWAVSAFALTYKAAKNFGDTKDPARVRMKQLKEIAAERAKVKNAPVLMDVSSALPTPTTKSVAPIDIAPEPVRQVSAKPAPAPEVSDLEADMGKKPPVDKNDPYAQLLTM
jgi:hypothetical protein